MLMMLTIVNDENKCYCKKNLIPYLKVGKISLIFFSMTKLGTRMFGSARIMKARTRSKLAFCKNHGLELVRNSQI